MRHSNTSRPGNSIPHESVLYGPNRFHRMGPLPKFAAAVRGFDIPGECPIDCGEDKHPAIVRVMSEGVSQAAWSSWSFPFWATAGLLAAGSALSPRLEQNSPHPAAHLSCLARVVLSRRPLHPLASDRLTSRHPGRPVAGRPYDTTSDTDVGGAALYCFWAHRRFPCCGRLPRSALRDGLGPFFRAHSLHRIIRLLTHPVIRVAGHEHRLHRLACPAGL